MKTFSVTVPDFIEISNQEVVMVLASQLYKNQTLSLGQAAEVAGLSKRSFAEMLEKNDVSIFNFPALDLINDVANA